MAIAFESISPSAGNATDRFVVRRGAGPADYTMELLTPASVKALLAISAADVSDFNEAVDDRVAALLVAGSNITITYDDVANTLTIDASGGGGSPGGASGEIQFNNAGAFGGAADVEIEDGQLRLPAISTPATPASGGLKLYSKLFAGVPHPTWLSPTGVEIPMQAFLGRRALGMFIAAGNGGTDTQWGLPVPAAGTATAENIANTSVWNSLRARSWRVTTASTTAIASLRANALQWTVGGNVAGRGGFFLTWIWGPATGVATTTNRALVGMRGSVAAPTDVEPSTLTNIVGMGWDAADTNVQMMHNDGSGTATKIDLGASFPVPTADTTQVYELRLFSPPGTTQSVEYEVINVNTGAVATGTITTNLPTTTTLVAPVGSLSVGGTSSVIGFMTSVLYIA